MFEKYDIIDYPERKYIIFHISKDEKYLISFSKSIEFRVKSDENSRKEYDFIAVKVMDVIIERSKSGKHIPIFVSNREKGLFTKKARKSNRTFEASFSFRKDTFERNIMDDFESAELIYELIE